MDVIPSQTIVSLKNFWTSLKSILGYPLTKKETHTEERVWLDREPEFKKTYQLWLLQGKGEPFLHWIFQQYAFFQSDLSLLDENIDFLNLPSAKGFVIHWRQSDFDPAEAPFLADLLMDKVKEIGYTLQISDVRFPNGKQSHEWIERHYLKPRLRYQPHQKTNQQYGNILIELDYRRNQPFQLKFQVTTYADQQFSKAKSFHGLMETITS